MSTLLEQASLVMIPSGYKEDVVYSQIPTDGSGDLSFTRASNGTRTNSAGLVEVCPWNLVEYSNSFSIGPWAIGIGGGSLGSLVADPFGGTTAQVLNLNNNGIFYNSSISTYPTTISTTSIWMRTQSGSVSIQLGNPVGSPYFTKTITTTWTRFDIQVNPASYNGGIALYNSVHGSAITIEIWGAQLNIGATAKPYFPTTDRLNVPRLTYQNGGGGCPSLLLEKQSTNLVPYSEQFDNSAWQKGNITVTANATTSPDGTTNADKISEDTSTGYHYVSYGTGFMSSTNDYTLTFYAKAAERTWCNVYFYNGTTAFETYFDLSNGAIGTIGSGVTATINSAGNGWYRCSVSKNIAGSSGANGGIITATGNNQGSFAGTSGSGLYIWGAQLEASSYATSYIPTTSSSATRVADVCNKNGIGALIGGTSGTVFFDITTNAVLSSSSYKQFCYYFDASAAQSYMYLNSANQLSTNTNWGSFVYSTPLVANTRYKVALVFAPNDFALYVNGVSVATASSGTPKDNVNLQIGQYNGSEMCEFVFNEYIHFPSRLTNAKLASLTTI